MVWPIEKVKGWKQDADCLAAMWLRGVRGTSHKERLEFFYGPQAHACKCCWKEGGRRRRRSPLQEACACFAGVFVLHSCSEIFLVFKYGMTPFVVVVVVVVVGAGRVFSSLQFSAGCELFSVSTHFCTVTRFVGSESGALSVSLWMTRSRL
jgi:hypothetical protein